MHVGQKTIDTIFVFQHYLKENGYKPFLFISMHETFLLQTWIKIEIVEIFQNLNEQKRKFIFYLKIIEAKKFCHSYFC